MISKLTLRPEVQNTPAQKKKEERLLRQQGERTKKKKRERVERETEKR